MKTKIPGDRPLQDVHHQQQQIHELEHLFRLVPDMICCATVDGYFKRINPAWTKILGYSTSELLSKPFLELVHPEDRESTQNQIDKQTRGIPVVAFENRYRCKDGSYRVFQWNSIADASGLLYAVARDITEKKQMQQALDRSHAILEGIGFSAEKFLRQVELKDPMFHEILEALGKASDVSRVYVSQNFHNKGGKLCFSQRYEWTAPKIEPQIDNPDEQNVSWEQPDLQETKAQLAQGMPVRYIVKDRPDSRKRVHRDQDIQSYVVVPIFVTGFWWGFIGFDECRYERQWEKQELNALLSVSALLGAMLERRQFEAKILAANETLEKKIARRTKALRQKSKRLEELNSALGVLLQKREKDKTMIEENVLTNAMHLIDPYLAKLKASRLDPYQKICLNILEANLKEITSPLVRRLSLNKIGLTPTELKVANLIKQGLNSKQISIVCETSIHTVNGHRKSIRNKFGLTGQHTNLRTFLLSLPK